MQKSHFVLSHLNRIWIVLCVILNNYMYCSRVFRPELSPFYAEFSSDEDDDLVVVAGDAAISRIFENLAGCEGASQSSALQVKTMSELTDREALEWLYAYEARESAPIGTYSGSGELRTRQVAKRMAPRSSNDFGPWVEKKVYKNFSVVAGGLARSQGVFLGRSLEVEGQRSCLQRVVLAEKIHNFIDEILAKSRSLRWSCLKFRPDYAVTTAKSWGFYSFEVPLCRLIVESCSIFLLKISTDQTGTIDFFLCILKRHKF